MFNKLRILSALVIAAALVPGLGAAEVLLSAIRPDNIGEFVRVSGKVTAFHLPPEPRAPYAFSISDAPASEMRVVVWPDIFERIDNHALLRQPGTSVTLTAEVAEYKERLELHLQDWEEIEIAPTTSAAVLRSSTAESSATAETTAPVQASARVEDR